MSKKPEAVIREYDRQRIPHAVVNLQFRDRDKGLELLSFLSPQELRGLEQASKNAQSRLSESDLYPNVELIKAQDIFLGRSETFAGNYAKLRLFQVYGRPLEILGCGKSGIPNVAVAAEAVSLEDALFLLGIEAKAIVGAQELFQGGMFRGVKKQLASYETRGIEQMQNPGIKNLCIKPGDQPGETYIGAYRGDPSAILDQLRLVNPEADFYPLDKEDSPINTPLMNYVLSDYRAAVAGITVNTPKISLVGVNGDLNNPEEVRAEFIREAATRSNIVVLEARFKEKGVSRLHLVGSDDAEGISFRRRLGLAAAIFKDPKVQVAVGGAVVGLSLALYLRSQSDKSKKA